MAIDDDNPVGGGEGLALEKYRARPTTSRFDLGVPGDGQCRQKILEALAVILKAASPDFFSKVHYWSIGFGDLPQSTCEVDSANVDKDSKIRIVMSGGNDGKGMLLIGYEENKWLSEFMATHSEGKAINPCSVGAVDFNNIGELSATLESAATALNCRAAVEAAIQNVTRAASANRAV